MGAVSSKVHGEMVAGVSLIAWICAGLKFGLPTTAFGWAVTALAFVWWQRFTASGFASPFIVSAQPPFRVEQEPADAGRIVLVTGANSGIGRQTVVLLLRAGYRVVLSCRTKIMAAATMQGVAAEAGVPASQVLMPSSAAAGGVSSSQYRLASIEMELDDLASVRAAAAQTAQVLKTAFGADAKLYCLVNNAGALATLLPDGSVSRMAGGCRVERNIGINFIAPIVLYDELKSRDVFARGARVIHTSSLGHFLGSTLLGGAAALRYALKHAHGEPIPRSAIPFAGRSAGVDQLLYCVAKLGTALTATALARESDIHHVSLHPGVVSTAFFRTSPLRFVPQWCAPTLLSFIMKTPTEGAYTTLRCVTAPAITNGAYYADSVPVSAPLWSPVAADTTLAAEVVQWAREQSRPTA